MLTIHQNPSSVAFQGDDPVIRDVRLNRRNSDTLSASSCSGTLTVSTDQEDVEESR